MISVYTGATAKSNARAIASAVTPVFMICFRDLLEDSEIITSWPYMVTIKNPNTLLVNHAKKI